MKWRLLTYIAGPLVTGIVVAGVVMADLPDVSTTTTPHSSTVQVTTSSDPTKTPAADPQPDAPATDTDSTATTPAATATPASAPAQPVPAPAAAPTVSAVDYHLALTPTSEQVIEKQKAVGLIDFYCEYSFADGTTVDEFIGEEPQQPGSVYTPVCSDWN